MSTDAVAAGMTPYRPSPPPTPGEDVHVTSRGVGSWGTPSCAEDLASTVGRLRARPRRSPDAVAHTYLAQRQPGGWTCVADRWTDRSGAADVLDRYLVPAEREVYDDLSAAVRPTWLLGRVAAKDAVRWWLADRGRRVEPAEVALANEDSGRPVIDHGASPAAHVWAGVDLRISIAHVCGTGVAIVSRGHDVGIDVEETAPRPGSFARVAFSARERAERAQAVGAHAAMDEPTWMASAWTAKEAAGKAAGTGLQGRPTRFVTRLVGPDLFAVGERLVRCSMLDPLDWCSQAGHSLVVGWTLAVDRHIDLATDGAVTPVMAGRGAGAVLTAGASR
jgi:phosphopantetheinyl transferase